MKTCKFLIVSACSLSLGFVTVANAQQNLNQNQNQQNQNQNQTRSATTQAGQAGQSGQGAQAGQGSHGMNTDQKLATCIAIANQEEIAVARLAQDKAKDDDVKDFAKMLVSEHQAYLKKLQRYAPDAARDDFLNDSSRGSRGDSSQTRSQGNDGNQSRAQSTDSQTRAQGADNKSSNIQQVSATGDQSGQHLDFMHLQREIAEQCVQSTKQKLNKEEGSKFDKCFVGLQIANHETLKSKLTVFERHASGELKQLISDGISTTDQHLKRAEELMKKIDKD